MFCICQELNLPPTNLWSLSISLPLKTFVPEEKRGTTFRSSTDEIFEILTWNNKTR